MRIIGGRDFYDGCMGVGAFDSDGDVFVRNDRCVNDHIRTLNSTVIETVTLSNGSKRKLRFDRAMNEFIGVVPDNYRHTIDRSKLMQVWLYFAGKAYLGAGYREVSYFAGDKYRVAWSDSAVIKMISEEFSLDITNRAFSKPIFGHRPDYDSVASEYLNNNDASIALALPIIHTPNFNVKVFLDTPRLKNFGVMSAISAPEAYQELAMWIANRARPERPMVKLSDASLIKKHGFDKMSFKKEKRRA